MEEGEKGQLSRKDEEQSLPVRKMYPIFTMTEPRRTEHVMESSSISPIILAIVGSRTFEDYPRLCLVLEAFIDKYGKPVSIVSGGAKGADKLAEVWARAKNLKILVLRPKWKKVGGVYDPDAGYARNSDIVAACTHMVAFPSPNGSGTQDSIAKAKAAGKVVLEY